MTRQALLSAAVAAAAALATTAGVLGHHPHPEPSPGPAVRPPGIEHIRTVGAWLCEGTLVTRYDLERLAGHEWAFRLDDGNVTVQTSPTTGRWVTLPSTSGGEGIRRVPATTVTALQPVRVVRHGIAATARLTQEGCPA